MSQKGIYRLKIGISRLSLHRHLYIPWLLLLLVNQGLWYYLHEIAAGCQYYLTDVLELLPFEEHVQLPTTSCRRGGKIDSTKSRLVYDAHYVYTISLSLVLDGQGILSSHDTTLYVSAPIF